MNTMFAFFNFAICFALRIFLGFHASVIWGLGCMFGVIWTAMTEDE